MLMISNCDKMLMISNCDDKLVCLELLTTRPLLQHLLVLALPHLFCSWLLPTARSSGNRRICGASVFSCQQSLVWKLHTPRIRCTNQPICWGSEQVYSVMSVPIWRFATTPNQICLTMEQQLWEKAVSGWSGGHLSSSLWSLISPGSPRCCFL